MPQIDVCKNIQLSKNGRCPASLKVGLELTNHRPALLKTKRPKKYVLERELGCNKTL